MTKNKKLSDWFRRSWLEALAFVVILLAVWLPRTIALNQFATADEHTWLTRSANFYYALGQRDFLSTYQKEHPGVSIMWAGTAGYLWRYPGYRGSGLGQVKTDRLHNFLTKNAGMAPLEILESSRQIMVLIITMTLALAYLFARQLIGTLPAFLAFLFIAFDPFHTALSRLLHLDGLLSSLLLLSLLAYLSFTRERRLVYLLVSALAAGFSWLTKSPGFFIIPIIAALALIELIGLLQKNKDSEVPKDCHPEHFANAQYELREVSHQLIRRFFTEPVLRNEGFRTTILCVLDSPIWRVGWPLILWGFVGLAIFVVFWPAMWVEPVETFSRVLLRAGSYVEEGHGNALFFDGRVVEDGKLGLGFAYFYPLTFLWRTTPAIPLGMLAAVFAFLTNRRPFNQPGTRITLLGLALFIATFTLALTMSAKKFDRYFLPVYAPLNIIAALGWTSIGLGLTKRVNSTGWKMATLGMYALLIGSQMFLSLRTYPYFLSYYNPLMGGGRKAPQVMQIGWGEGLDQAGRYLANKENAEHLRVLSWYSRGSLSYFFPGHSLLLRPNAVPDLEEDKAFQVDYVVIYRHNWQREIPQATLEYFAGRSPEKSIWINGIEYARIYKVDQ